jgi:hypothetical protein
VIGAGAIGGKGGGLVAARDFLEAGLAGRVFPGLTVAVPPFSIVATGVFDAFLRQNDLLGVALSGEPFHRLAHAFQRAGLPADALGDLWALVRSGAGPLAVRSSSLLEDALRHPFAGVYATKMIPNNQPDAESRFRRLTEAIKFVYASAFAPEAKDYLAAAGCDVRDEKMAVILQEVVGGRHGPRLYPDVSGVARSWNFYPTGSAEPGEGVVNLALGLGKTIVDGGKSWTYSPAHPRATPPYGSMGELLEQTQTELWAVNVGTPPPYDPIAETEYLVRASLADAEEDGTLRYTASTYDTRSDRVVIGTAQSGARVLNFAPLLVLEEAPLNDAVRAVLEICEDATEAKVEIEFAVTLPADGPARFGFLQVRPMAVSLEPVGVGEDEMAGASTIVASRQALGNGIIEAVHDVVHVKPEAFDPAQTNAMAEEIGEINHRLVAAKRPYVLIGFGRWGSSDPWLGIPVSWSQISGAKVIVEGTLPSRSVEPSQGTHFFHNLVSFGVAYLSVPAGVARGIDWDAIDRFDTRSNGHFVRHAESLSPLRVKVDGRSRRGVILSEGP